MCGFAGFQSVPVDFDARGVITHMGDSIAHRGPDSEGYYLDGRVALGFRRLSIVDLEAGSQPMINEDASLVLCFNGEIYNHDKLREELSALGHTFKTRCDSEVLIHGWEQYHEGLLPRLRGMYAFVVYDTRSGEIFGARDIFGIKPFYYYFDARGSRDTATGGDEGLYQDFIFGSEIKAFLRHPHFHKEFNRQMLLQYLCFEYLPNNATLFKNVFKLPAGHCFTYRDGRMNIKKYHSFEYDIDESKTMDQWSDEIYEAVQGSCRVHLNADVEVGCFLSAGVDSSLITREVSRLKPVQSFSVGYAEQRYSELGVAKDFAASIGVQNFSSEISADDFFDAVPFVQYHMDEPLPNPSAIPLHFVAKEASERVKVVLSGEGADELFGGYSYYQECLDFESYMHLPQMLRMVLGSVAEKLPAVHGRRFLMRGCYPLSKRYIRNTYVFSFEESMALLKGQTGTQRPEFYTADIFSEVKSFDEVTQMQYADMNIWLPLDILQKADKMSMAHSLELRVPYLDREVLAAALALPARYRVTRNSTKPALRRAARKILSNESATRPKIGFVTPLDAWLRQDKYYDRVRAVFESEMASSFFNTNGILALLDDHKNGKSKNMKKIWTIYCFLVWFDEYFIKR